MVESTIPVMIPANVLITTMGIDASLSVTLQMASKLSMDSACVLKEMKLLVINAYQSVKMVR